MTTEFSATKLACTVVLQHQILKAISGDVVTLLSIVFPVKLDYFIRLAEEARVDWQTVLYSFSNGEGQRREDIIDNKITKSRCCLSGVIWMPLYARDVGRLVSVLLNIYIYIYIYIDGNSVYFPKAYILRAIHSCWNHGQFAIIELMCPSPECSWSRWWCTIARSPEIDERTDGMI